MHILFVSLVWACTTQGNRSWPAYSDQYKHRWKDLYIIYCLIYSKCMNYEMQHAKKVVSDNSGLVDFAVGLVNCVFNLPDGQVIFF